MPNQAWNELVDFIECVGGALLMAAGIVSICSFIYLLGA